MVASRAHRQGNEHEQERQVMFTITLLTIATVAGAELLRQWRTGALS